MNPYGPAAPALYGYEIQEVVSNTVARVCVDGVTKDVIIRSVPLHWRRIDWTMRMMRDYTTNEYSASNMVASEWITTNFVFISNYTNVMLPEQKKNAEHIRQ